jgi:hypothetical protein
MERVWLLSLAWCVGFVTALPAQDTAWQPSGPGTAAVVQSAALPLDAPQVTLGRPVALEETANGSGVGRDPLVPVSYNPSAASTSVVARAQTTDPGAAPLPGPPPFTSPAVAPSPAEQYNCGVANQAPGTDHPFWDKTKNFFTGFPWFGGGEYDTEGRHHWFESDHSFDDFASPVTNPFFFEDPRALTEVRPLFMYQETPIGNPIFHGGDVEYLGLQGRVAITECWSLVWSELGIIWMEPHNADADFQPHDGFAQITIGPKWTFLRNETTGTIAAAGLNFIFPAGDRKVLQDTGSLSMEPYISAGQRFGHIPNWGTFHALGTLGYNLGVDDKRSDNFFLSLHVDFDYGDLHKIYPFIEMTNYLYTSNGNAHTLNFEGGDLANFGSTNVSGRDELTLALGARFKLNECVQMGFAVETPLTTHRQLMDYRLTFDLIFRY